MKVTLLSYVKYMNFDLSLYINRMKLVFNKNIKLSLLALSIVYILVIVNYFY
jgi:hypothetical protein